jgi:hypothetical protein
MCSGLTVCGQSVWSEQGWGLSRRGDSCSIVLGCQGAGAVLPVSVGREERPCGPSHSVNEQSDQEAWKLPLRATVRQEVHGEDKWRWEVKWGQTGWSRHCTRSRAGSCHPSRVQGEALGRRNSKEKRPRYQTRVSIIVPVHK